MWRSWGRWAAKGPARVRPPQGEFPSPSPQLAHQVLNLCMIVCSALVIWKSLVVITESESPVVVVLSGSMEPAFHRGDILFLNMGYSPFRAGDIVVFKVADRDIPIVHRVIKVHEKPDGSVDLLSKVARSPRPGERANGISIHRPSSFGPCAGGQQSG